MEEETKKLIKELLDEGYDSGFISSELGISKKKIQQIKSRRYLPELSGANMPKANQKERQIQEINGQHQKRTIVRQQTHQNTNKWEISEEELEGPELGREQVCNLISDLLKKRGVQDQNPDVIGTALNKAQIDASKRHKNEGKQLPMKLRQNSELLLDQFAIIKIGQPGRGKSSKYKKIKTENAYDV